MSERNRLVTLVLEVADLDKSVQLYREDFGLDLHVTYHLGADRGQEDRRISGRHAATTWKEGAFLHFTLYESKGERTSGAQLAFRVDGIAAAHLVAIDAGARLAPRSLAGTLGHERAI